MSIAGVGQNSLYNPQHETNGESSCAALKGRNSFYYEDEKSAVLHLDIPALRRDCHEHIRNCRYQYRRQRPFNSAESVILILRSVTRSQSRHASGCLVLSKENVCKIIAFVLVAIMCYVSVYGLSQLARLHAPTSLPVPPSSPPNAPPPFRSPLPSPPTVLPPACPPLADPPPPPPAAPPPIGPPPPAAPPPGPPPSFPVAELPDPWIQSVTCADGATSALVDASEERCQAFQIDNNLIWWNPDNGGTFVLDEKYGCMVYGAANNRTNLTKVRWANSPSDVACNATSSDAEDNDPNDTPLCLCIRDYLQPPFIPPIAPRVAPSSPNPPPTPIPPPFPPPISP